MFVLLYAVWVKIAVLRGPVSWVLGSMSYRAKIKVHDTNVWYANPPPLPPFGFESTLLDFGFESTLLDLEYKCLAIVYQYSFES